MNKQTKVCTKCGIEKPLSEFNNNKKGKYGKRSDCRECQKESKRKWREDNLDKVKEYNKQWRENNPNYMKEYNKQWRENNQDYMREYSKSEKEKESHRKRNRKYSQSKKGREAQIIRNQNRKSMKKSLISNFTVNEWEEILKHFNNKCVLTEKENPSREHFIALSTGHLGTCKENIYPMELSLNISKHNKNPFVWIKSQTEKSKERFYNVLVPYMAELNNMSVKEYESFVNYCYKYPRDKEQIEFDNKAGITSKDLFYAWINTL